jgi:hypothetical protein
MMDYYSNFQGPTRSQAIQLIQAKMEKEWLKKLVVRYVDAEIAKYGGLGSQTGWIVGTEPSIRKHLLYQENLYKKVKKTLYFMQIYNVFLKMYLKKP